MALDIGRPWKYQLQGKGFTRRRRRRRRRRRSGVLREGRSHFDPGESATAGGLERCGNVLLHVVPGYHSIAVTGFFADWFLCPGLPL